MRKGEEFEVDDIELEKVSINKKKNENKQEEIPTHQQIQLASLLINASFTETRIPRKMIEENASVFWYKLKVNMWLIRTVLVVILMVLSFFERPSWCYRTDCNTVKNPEKIVDGTEAIIYFSGFPVLTPEIGLGIELFCLIALFFTNSFLSLFISGLKDFFTKPGSSFLGFVIIIVSIIDIIVSYCVDRTWRVSQFLRPILMVVLDKHAKKTAEYIIRSLPKIFEVLLLTVFVIGFFSWMGLLLWYQKYNQNLFNDIRTSISSVNILLTTCNFPDVMTPFYQVSWWSFLFFISFFAFGYYLFHPIVLAVTYQSYKLNMKTQKTRRETRRIEYLTRAFKLLDPGDTGELKLGTFSLVLDELATYSDLPKIKTKNYKYFFTYTANQKSAISLNNFLEFPRHLSKKFFSKRDPVTHSLFPTGHTFIVIIFTEHHNQVYYLAFSSTKGFCPF
eukprot:TRINITY_DN766_c0_g2_i1.p1 TRINITY_DN766_c0_g2~~TRINITY_DN766_c0_g2_i1.p1  ORF type:complete len:448 (-),score=72.02 TRINITY_DN766_c0_g2_i1:37-1380(-)